MKLHSHVRQIQMHEEYHVRKNKGVRGRPLLKISTWSLKGQSLNCHSLPSTNTATTRPQSSDLSEAGLSLTSKETAPPAAPALSARISFFCTVTLSGFPPLVARILSSLGTKT